MSIIKHQGWYYFSQWGGIGHTFGGIGTHSKMVVLKHLVIKVVVDTLQRLEPLLRHRTGADWNGFHSFRDTVTGC